MSTRRKEYGPSQGLSMMRALTDAARQVQREEFNKIVGSPEIDPKAIQQMRARGGRWYAYENHALDSVYLGRLQFLRCDPDRTYTTPPTRMPDTQTSINWAYQLIGELNLETGWIEARQ